MLISVALLQDLHHDPREQSTQHFKALITVILYVCYKEVVFKIVIVSGKVRQIHLEHHHEIILVCTLETVHFPVIENEYVSLLESICIISVPQYHTSVKDIHHLHIIMEMNRIFCYVRRDHIDRQLILVNDFFF